MPLTVIVQRITSLDDPRVAFYRNLRERTLRGESIFLAEGKVVTQRLLQSGYDVESLLLDQRYLSELAPLIPANVPVYVTEEKFLEQIVGFKYHQGVLAAGRRKPEPTLDDLVANLASQDSWRLVICPEVTKPENLGLIFRSAAGFDLDGVILGPQACDPLSRRVLRVSMGAVLFTPFARCRALPDALKKLKAEYQLAIVAAVVDRQATPLDDFTFPARVGLLVGSEYYGVPEILAPLADYRVTIPMSDKIDSLNLGVATGILAYRMSLSASRSRDRGHPY